MMAINDRVIQVKQALIKDVCNTINAHIKIQKNDYLNDGKFPIIDQSSNPIAGYTDVEKAVIDNGEYVIFGDHTRIIKFVDFPFAQGADGIKIIKACSYVQPKFLYYSLCNLDIPNKGYSRHWGLVSNLNINIPSVNVQEELVKILDSFTNLIDALNEELSLRQKQFEYYREKLLTFDETVERLSFGNDFSLKARIGWQGLTKKEYRKSGDYYLITGTDFKDGNKIDFSTCVYVDEERYTQDPNIQIKPNDVLITKDGTLGKVAFIEKIDKPATINGGLFVVRSKVGGVIPKYVAYDLSSQIFKNWIEQNHTNGSIMHLTQKLLVKFEIAIPSTDVQQSIVEKLDAFESLISSLKEEIALRQKQYEYYREKLLTFD